MNVKQGLALTAGLATAGFTGYFIYKKLFTRYLYISAGEGGTTDPPPGTYSIKLMEKVTIKAVPNTGYTYGTWIVDGVDQGHVPEITITMDTNHTVICTFWKGGTPPPTYPVALQSLGSIYVETLIGAWLTGTPAVDQCIHVAQGYPYPEPKIRFKAIDAEGKGVPDVDVALWTDPMPDSSRYKGTVLLNKAVHTADKPLIVKTDSEGIAQADVRYLYGLNDRYAQICKDAGVGYQFGCLILPCVEWVRARDGDCLLPTCYVCWTTGDCETGKAGCEAMGPWQPNRITAQIVGTAIQAMEYAYCGFHVAWVRPE